jgi:lysophospholipase L1-like esterase
VVAIGDSIPFNLDADCPGCTGFVESYAKALEAERGEPVLAVNRSRHDGARTIDIVEQLKTDETLLRDLASAGVVVMSVGFNDQPPFVDQHPGCPPPVSDPAPTSDVAKTAAATTSACIDTVVAVIRAQIADVFASVREVAPRASIAALTAYDSWRGWPELDAVDPATVEALYAAETAWFHEWNAAMCEEAAAVKATCIDVYAAFNGADGTDPPAEFVAADYTHPSQRGNDVIRDLLVEAALLDQ